MLDFRWSKGGGAQKSNKIFSSPAGESKNFEIFGKNEKRQLQK